jgi:hypothetical protein
MLHALTAEAAALASCERTQAHMQCVHTSTCVVAFINNLVLKADLEPLLPHFTPSEVETAGDALALLNTSVMQADKCAS